MEDLYYQINHKGSLQLMEKKVFGLLISNFFVQLASQGDNVTFPLDITQFIVILTKRSKVNYHFKDKLDVLNELADLYSRKVKIDLADTQQCTMLCQRVSLRNYRTDFVFQSAFVEEIAAILCYGFKSLRIHRGNSLTYPSFLYLVKCIREANVDIVNQYRYSRSIQIKEAFTYGIPNPLILLMNKFSEIKRLSINLEEWSEESLLAYSLIILNYEWLFFTILDVSYDVSCVFIQKKIWAVHERELYFLNKEMKRKSSIGSNESDNTNKTIDNETLSEIIDNHSNIFLLVILYSYFISTLSNLIRLSIVIPQNFKNEINDSLAQVSIKVKSSFHFFHFLTPITSLSTLSIDFNSLEGSSFGQVISLIHSNSHLKYLTLSLFSRRDDHYYSSPSIYKTAQDEGISLSSLSATETSGCVVTDVFSCNSNDFTVIDIALLKRLLPFFEENMEKLFVLLHSKMDLLSFQLHFDIPKRLQDNEKYFFTLLKFVFNVLLLLHRERLNVTELKLISPMMLIDNRKYPLVEKYFDAIDLTRKNKRLTTLHLHFTFISLSNVCNAVSVYLKFLSLGDLDLESLNAFLEFYQSEKFAHYSSLVSLTLSLSKTIYDLNTFKPQLAQVMTLRRPFSLRQFALHCNAMIKPTEMRELLLRGNGNQVEKYAFTIKQVISTDYLFFDYEEYYYVLSDAPSKAFQWTVIRVLSSLHALSGRIFNNVISYTGKGQIKRRKEVVIKVNY